MGKSSEKMGKYGKEVCMNINSHRKVLTAMLNYRMGLSFYFNGVLRLESWDLL